MQEQTSLDLPPIDPAMIAPTPAAAQTALLVGDPAGGELRRIDLKAVALAKFGPWRADLALLKERFSRVAWHPADKKGLEDLKQAIRDAQQPRYDAQNYVEELATTLRQVSKVCRDELELVQAGYHAIEDPLAEILKQHQNAEKAAADKRAAEAAERRKVLDARLDVIRECATRCEGIEAARIANGIAQVAAIDIGDDWGDAKPEAQRVQAQTLAVMRMHHAKALAAEAEAAEKTRLEDENRRLHAELAIARAQGSSRTFTSGGGDGYRAAPAVPDTQSGPLPGDAPAPIADRPTAAPPSPEQSGATYASNGAEAAASPSGDEPEASADERAFARTFDPPVTVANGDTIHIAEDGSVSVTKAGDEPACDPVEHELDRMEQATAAALDALRFTMTAFDTKFPSHPKPVPEWWAELRRHTVAAIARLEGGAA